MKTTTRKTTTLQATAMPTAQPGPPPFPRRPLLPDAPDWFNRARLLTNQRQTVALRPVPLAQNRFIPHGGAAGHRQIRNKMIVLGLSLVALPAVFLMGFWTHRLVAPAQPHAVSSDVSNVPVQVVAALDRKNEVAQHFVDEPTALPVPGAAPALLDGIPTSDELPTPEEQPPEIARRRRPPKPSTIAATMETGTQPLDRVVSVAAAEGSPEPVDGFALRSPVAEQFVADIHVPGNSWFSLAAANLDCESGTCKIVPVKTADRKLNTALEWSSTPKQAAEQAAREGKLVFLIHVSGNFSQPGFT